MEGVLRKGLIIFLISLQVTKLPLSSPVTVLTDFLKSENNSDVDPITRFGFRILLIYKDLFGCK